jgi:hypothetical protein
MEAQQVVPLKSQPQFVRLWDIVVSLTKQPPRWSFVDASNFFVRRELFDVANMLFNDDEEMVGRLAREYFVDELHALYFLEYVYKSRRDVCGLVFAPHYLGITLCRTIEIMSEHKIYEIRKYYVIGVNDYKDGLFINEFGEMPPGLDPVTRNDNFAISASKDEYFRRYFGYDEDILKGEAVLTLKQNNEPTRYRVSGEIVFAIQRADDDYIKSLFSEQVWRYITYMVADKMMRVLIDHGFNPELPREHIGWNTAEIQLPGISSELIMGDSDEARIIRVMKMFAQIIGKYFTILEISTKGFLGISISDEMVRAFVSFVFNDEKLEKSLSLWITLSVLDEDSPARRTHDSMMRDVINNVKDLLYNSERSDELMIGNHYIRIERGLPVNFVYEPKIRPKLLDPMLITVYRPRTFLVTPRTRVTIEHVQHGTRHISFDGTYALEITTTNVSNGYLEKLNAITLKKLLVSQPLMPTQ